MARLYLRIGTHKTGSSAIQTALREEAKSLRRENIIVLPLFRGARMLKTIGYYNDALVRAGRDHFRSAAEKHSRNPDTRLVMSYEGLSGFPHAGYENSAVIADMLRAMTEGIETYIIVYLRRQDSFIESMYTQMIHSGKELSFPAYMDRIKDKAFDWSRLVQNHADRFGKEHVIVRPYDRRYLTGSHSLMHSYADIIGSQVLKHGKSRFGINAGYTQQAADIAKSCNPHLSRKESEKLRLILQTTKAKRPFESYGYLSAEERAEILNRYAEGNARVAREYLNEPNGIMFSDPAEADEERQGQAAASPEVAAADQSQARAVLGTLSKGNLGLVIRNELKRVLGGKGRFTGVR